LTAAISSVLIDLAAEWGVHELEGLTEEQLEVVAVRLMVETQDRPTARYLRKIANEVKRAGGGQAKASPVVATAQEPAPPSLRYTATERTTRARKERDADRRLSMAQRHDRESRRTGLYVVPKRPEQLEPLTAHPSCIAADAEGVRVCIRCAPLLHPATCECEACNEWWERQA
jgi:hypothetical protein